MITGEQKQKYGNIVARIQLRQLLEDVALAKIMPPDAQELLDQWMAQVQCRQADYVRRELETLRETMSKYTNLANK